MDRNKQHNGEEQPVKNSTRVLDKLYLKKKAMLKAPSFFFPSEVNI